MPSRYPVEVRKQVVELARSGTRVAQLVSSKTELAVSRKVNEVFLEQNLPPKPLPGDCFPGRAGV